jgi:uncharacterized membrane protein
MRNQTLQQPQLDPKGKAIISLVLGIVSILLGLLPTLFLGLGMNPMAPSPILNIVFLLPLVVLIGIVFGILGLKSTKKKFAIAGIVLCLIGLIVPLYYFLR